MRKNKWVRADEWRTLKNQLKIIEVRGTSWYYGTENTSMKDLAYNSGRSTTTLQQIKKTDSHEEYCRNFNKVLYESEYAEDAFDEMYCEHNWELIVTDAYGSASECRKCGMRKHTARKLTQGVDATQNELTQTRDASTGNRLLVLEQQMTSAHEKLDELKRMVEALNYICEK